MTKIEIKLLNKVMISKEVSPLIGDEIKFAERLAKRFAALSVEPTYYGKKKLVLNLI